VDHTDGSSTDGLPFPSRQRPPAPWPSRGIRFGDVSSTPAHCNDKMHFSHYYFKIHNGTATVEEICVSEHGQRGPNSCRPHARDGISRTGQCRAGVDGGQGRRSDVSRSDATTSSCNRPPANRRDRVGSTPRPRLRKNGSSKTAGTPVRDRSRHGGRRAIGSGASIVGPRAVGIRRGQPACAIACTTRASWLPYHWRLADSTRKRRPALRRSRRHRPPHRLPRHAGLPLAVRRADTTVAEAHRRGKTRSCCSFC
jgi:hypothetical protein